MPDPGINTIGEMVNVSPGKLILLDGEIFEVVNIYKVPLARDNWEPFGVSLKRLRSRPLEAEGEFKENTIIRTRGANYTIMKIERKPVMNDYYIYLRLSLKYEGRTTGGPWKIWQTAREEKIN